MPQCDPVRVLDRVTSALRAMTSEVIQGNEWDTYVALSYYGYETWDRLKAARLRVTEFP